MRAVSVLGAAAVLASALAVAVAALHRDRQPASVTAWAPAPHAARAQSPGERHAAGAVRTQRRIPALSRSADRVTLAARPVVRQRLWMTESLNLWTVPGEHGRLLRVLRAGQRVGVTGRRVGHWAEVAVDGLPRWVNADYLSATKPATSGPVVSGAPCASGSSMESGLVAAAVRLHRSVCAHFPQVTTYGGWRADGEHSDGHAIDIMVYSDAATGQAIADWVRANAATLGVDDVIWSQHIWTTQRSSEGWRLMPDRGSTTANHYDHVHVRVF